MNPIYDYYNLDKINRESERFIERNRDYNFDEVDEKFLVELEHMLEVLTRVTSDTKGKSLRQIEMQKKNKLLIAYSYLNSIYTRNKLNSTQNIVLIVNHIDPELKMLQIFYECSKEDDIRRAIKEEFGFYNKDFIKIEKIYNEYFKLIEDPFNMNKKSKTRK